MSAAQRIAIISPRYPEAGAVGGAETLLRNLAEHLVQQGREVHFLTTCARDHHSWENTVPEGVEEKNGVQVHFFPVNESRDLETFLQVQDLISRGAKVSRAQEEAWRDNNVNSAALEQHLRDSGADYDAILMGPYLFGLTMTCSSIHPDRTWLVPCLHDECFAYLSIMHDQFATCRGILFNAAPEMELGKRLYDVDDAKCHVVGMGMEVHASDPTVIPQRLGFGDTPYVLYSGRREGLKGTPLMLAYLETYLERTNRPLKLVLTGAGGIEPGPLLKPHIHDLGYVSEEDKHHAMAGAAAFIHPSVNESFGIVLMEAWLAGTACLVHGLGEVLPDQCRRSNGGLWFRNYPEFESMLNRLLDSESLRTQLGANGRAWVQEEYSWDAVGRRLLTALDGAAS